MFKAEINLSSEKVAACFVCGTESLAASAVRFMRDKRLQRKFKDIYRNQKDVGL